MRLGPAKCLRWGAVLGAALLLTVQLIPVERTNPAVQTTVTAPATVTSILRRACFDCHSNETRWPWYSHLAPVSWLTVKHVREGRRDLNFSQWPAFDFTAQSLILREIEKQVANGNMPPLSYKLGHPEARLTADERGVLLDWAKSDQGGAGEIW